MLEDEGAKEVVDCFEEVAEVGNGLDTFCNDKEKIHFAISFLIFIEIISKICGLKKK